ncbi:MAG: glycoside hydrolase family 172 protein [Planctomycetota bacterium]
MLARLALLGALVAPTLGQVTFASAVDAMTDLVRLTRAADPGDRTIQFASQDRRSLGPEQPGWFANSDGFGGETQPGFAAVLRAPDADGNGSFLVADVDGPGIVVRTWSAGMAGTLRVHLDGAEAPVFEGPGYDFLARRSRAWLDATKLGVDVRDAFVQEDADYLPIPFARHLRITWDGNVRELHFYHVQVRILPADTAVTTFRIADVAEAMPRIERLVRIVRDPDSLWRELEGMHTAEKEGEIAPNAVLDLEVGQDGGGAVRALVVQTHADVTPTALRQVLLRIACDDAQRPQVEAPLGDFFGSGPGINPFESLPMSVAADGKFTCRLPMPFRKGARIELRNLGATPFACTLRATVAPLADAQTALGLHAKWRVDHDLDPKGGKEPIDLPYVMVRGRGRLVGAACMLMNPSPIPTPGGNWWGEGDEKIVVDEDAAPALFGTGSEDFYNYSWSRPDLFAHPYCGQPLDTGPGNAGYVSNHRFLVADDVPFARSLWFAMELWTHRPLQQLSYGRIAYYYAALGALDDHRALQKSELVVPRMPRSAPVADGAAARATFHYVEDALGKEQARTSLEPADWLSRGHYLRWQPERGGRLAIKVPVVDDARYAVHVVLVHAPSGGRIRALLDGEPLGGAVSVASEHLTFARSAALGERRLSAGAHELAFECTEPGVVGFEYVWLRRERD